MREFALKVFEQKYPQLGRIIREKKYNHPLWNEAFNEWYPFLEGFKAGWRARE